MYSVSLLNCSQFSLWKQLTSPCKETKNEHWLEMAKNSFPNDIINDTKKTLHILCLYIPLSIFWSLFDQQVNIINKSCESYTYYLYKPCIDLAHNLDFSSIADKWPFVWSTIFSLHATSDKPLARAIHYSIYGPYSLPLFEES